MTAYEDTRWGVNPYIIFSYLGKNETATREELINYLVDSYPGTEVQMPWSIEKSAWFVDKALEIGKLKIDVEGIIRSNLNVVN